MSSHYSGRLFSNFIALSVIQGTNFLLPILVMPHVIKKIGIEGFGVISIAQVIMVFFSAVSDYGFNLTATRDISLNKENYIKISKIFFLVLISKMLITFFLFFVLLIFVLFIPMFQQHLILYLLGFTYVIGQSFLVSWFFQGVEKMYFITIITLLARLIFVLLVFLYIRQKEDNVFFLFYLGLGNIIAGLLSIYLAIRLFRLQFVPPTFKSILYELKGGWQITLSNLSINTTLYSNIFILGIFTNVLVVGYYSIAEKIFFAIRQLLGIFSQVIYPRICGLAIKSKERLPSFFKKIYLPFLFLMIVFCTGIFIFAPYIIPIFLSGSSQLPVLLLKMLSFVPIIVCLNIPAYQLLLAFNKKRSYAGILSLGTLINITLNLMLCSAWGAVGTVISIIITELFITFGLNQQLYKHKLIYFRRSETL